MMWRIRVALTFLILSPWAFARTGRIVGIVEDGYGVPVPHISVEACPAEGGIGMILPGAETDEHGRFVLQITISPHTATDRWAVYAYDEDERNDRKKGFYPKPSEFLGNRDARRAPIVTISQRTPEASVEITLSAKAGALSGKVFGVPGLPVAPTFNFARVSSSENGIGFSYSHNRVPYRILLPPNTSLTLSVTAPGYKPWSSTGPISIGSGQEQTLDIRLEPESREGPVN